MLVPIMLYMMYVCNTLIPPLAEEYTQYVL